MKIERLKTYNQKLLAILGSILVLMAAIGLIMLIFFAITELTDHLRFSRQDQGILSEEQIEELQEDNLRKQLISYDFPQLVDTINSIYIIPVKHKTLHDPEYIDEDVLGILDVSGSFKTDKRFSSSRYGSFNNLIIYDLESGSTKVLFDQRINFGEIRTEVFDDDILVLFSAAEGDSYRDGVINLDDLKSLFIYSIKDENLRRISIDGMDIEYFNFIHDQKDLLISFGVDSNGDGQFDFRYEPSVIKKYIFKTGTVIDIVDEKVNTDLQKLLEGSKK